MGDTGKVVGMATTVKTVALRVNVTPEFHAAIMAEAERHDVSVAHVVRKAIREHLLRGENDGNAD